MVELIDIRGYVEQLAYITSTALDMDVLICDATGYIIGDNENKGEVCLNVESLRDNSVILSAMDQSKTIIYNNAKIESEGCITCPNLSNCHTETIIAKPLIKEGIVQGGIGVYSQHQRQKDKLIKVKDIMIQFLDVIGDLVIKKLEEETYSIKLKAENLRMDSIIETLDFSILSFDESENILFSNRSMKEILKGDLNRHRIKELLKLGDIEKNSMNRKETNVYIKRDKKYIEYELTYMPIIIDNAFKGAQIYLKEVSQLLNKANELMKPVKSSVFDDIIGESPQIIKVKEEATAFADSISNVLIQGESGTGKEIFASSIHNAGKRASGPFIAVNCAAIPDNLLESELFGYVRGAFTGAIKEGRAGKFEIANGGTLFLDEIGELPIHLQPKLLRALQEKKIQRVGSNRWIDIDIRIIAATNRDLTEMVANGTFREDLYYRLCVIPIRIPPLRERRSDISLIANYFLKMYKTMLNKKHITGFDATAMAILEKCQWLGNVRELQNTVEYAVNRCSSTVIQSADLPVRVFRSADKKIKVPQLLSEIEKQEISNALKYFEGSADPKEKAASSLGISRATMYRKIKEYHL